VGKYYDIYLRPGDGLEWNGASLDGAEEFYSATRFGMGIGLEQCNVSFNTISNLPTLCDSWLSLPVPDKFGMNSQTRH